MTPEIDGAISDVAHARIIENTNRIQDRPARIDRAVRDAIVIGVDICADRGRARSLEEKIGGRAVLEFSLAGFAPIVDRTGGAIAPSGALSGIGQQSGV